ncbi:hypothetical protein ACHMWU_23195 [Aeromicrobium sp. UC242_57]
MRKNLWVLGVVWVSCAATSACMAVPADPIASDIAIRRDGQQVEIAIALCPDERFSGLIVNPYVGTKIVNSPVWQGASSAGAAPGTSTHVINVGRLDDPEVLQVSAEDDLLFQVETAFTAGTSRTNSFAWKRSELDKLPDRQWFEFADSTTNPEEMSATGCDRPLS